VTTTSTRSFTSFVFAPPAFGGLIGALVCWWFSLLPSLLPRAWVMQAAVTGISMAFGYAVGTLIGSVGRWLIRKTGWRGPDASLRRWAWIALAVTAGLALVVGVVLWQTWQTEQRDLVQLPHTSWLLFVPMVLVALVLFAILFFLGRTIGYSIWRLDRFIDRHMPLVLARLIAASVVTVVVVVLAQEVVVRGMTSYVDSKFGPADANTAPGVVQPTTAAVSGSPDSFAAWDSLGYQGRSFVAGGTGREDLIAFGGPQSEVLEPVRVYAGLESADSVHARADLVVQELERTDAAGREILVVAAVTGTGWVDPDAARAIEYMHGGDTAIAGMQYSFLPSWISFLVDQSKSAESSEALYEAVHQWWSQLPEGDRPRLIVFGESLGSYGSEVPLAGTTAADSVANAVGGSDCALWAGPTNANPIWRQILEARVPDSPVWRAVYEDGRELQVANRSEDVPIEDQSWQSPRLLYFHHPSDPVGYWSWETLWRQPEWTEDPKGYDVSPHVGWFPFITFTQVVADLIAGFDAPSGFGHNYNINFVKGWTAVAPADGWTAEDGARLEQIIESTTES
jgi:uncharacterized membrane protein